MSTFEYYTFWSVNNAQMYESAGKATCLQKDLNVSFKIIFAKIRASVANYVCKFHSEFLFKVKHADVAIAWRNEMIKFVKKQLMATLHKPDEVEMQETDVLTLNENPYNLIVWNDEVNTFEWVIETLIEICKHTHEQAEQCAMIIHTQGKYAVKQGTYDELKPMCDAITERGIGATIEILSES